MKNELMTTEGSKPNFKTFVSQIDVRERFQQLLKDKADIFLSTLMVMVNNSVRLRECEYNSIISAAIIAASLDLSIDPNIGQAAIVPYNEKQANGTYLKKAQFQIMYKGLNQLAMRTSQYTRLGVTEIYEGQLVSENPLTGDYVFDFTVKPSKVIGYAAYFRLSNNFEKTIYWSVDKTKAHGQKYSKSFKGMWTEDFDAMSKKTVLKELLSKWGILSVDMKNAIKYDQAVVTQDLQPIYIDNPKTAQVEESFQLTPEHKDWSDAKEALKMKAITIDQLRERYDIDIEHEKLLTDEGNKVQD